MVVPGNTKKMREGVMGMLGILSLIVVVDRMRFLTGLRNRNLGVMILLRVRILECLHRLEVEYRHIRGRG